MHGRLSDPDVSFSNATLGWGRVTLGGTGWDVMVVNGDVHLTCCESVAERKLLKDPQDGSHAGGSTVLLPPAATLDCCSN